jgi:hypothetical protein
MARLDTERQKQIEPRRMGFCKEQIQKLGFSITFQDENKIEFIFKNNTIQLFPYSGWHSGKGIKAGRGLMKLITQLKS